MRSLECGCESVGGASGVALLGAFGPMMPVYVGYDPAYERGSGAVPEIPDEEYHALVDTRPQLSAVAVILAAALDLPVVDRRVYAGAGGMFEVNVHTAQVSVPVIVASVGTIFAVAVQPLRDVWVLTKKRTVTNQLVIHGTPVIRSNSPLPIATSLQWP